MKRMKLILLSMMMICQLVLGGWSSAPQNENKASQTNGEQIIVGEACVMIPKGWKFDFYLKVDGGECYVYTKDLSMLFISSEEIEFPGKEEIEKYRERVKGEYVDTKLEVEEERMEGIQTPDAKFEYEISDVQKYPIGQGYGITLDICGNSDLIEDYNPFLSFSEEIGEDRIDEYIGYGKYGEYGDYIYSAHRRYSIIGMEVNGNAKQMKAIVDETVGTMQEVQCAEEERKTEDKRISVGNMNVLLPDGWTLHNHTTSEKEDYYWYTKDLGTIIVKANKTELLLEEISDEEIEQESKSFLKNLSDKNTVVGSDTQNYSFGKGYRQWNNRIFSSDDSYNVVLDYFIPGFKDRTAKKEKIAYSIHTTNVIYSDNWEYTIIGYGVDYDIEQMKALISDMVDSFQLIKNAETKGSKINNEKASDIGQKEKKRVCVGKMSVIEPEGWEFCYHDQDDEYDSYLYKKDSTYLIISEYPMKDPSIETLEKERLQLKKEIEEKLKSVSDMSGHTYGCELSQVQDYPLGKGYKFWYNIRIDTSNMQAYKELVPDEILKEINEKDKQRDWGEFDVCICSDDARYQICVIGLDSDVEQMKKLIDVTADSIEVVAR